MGGRDVGGEEHTLTVARNVAPFAVGVKIVHLPGLPEHGDVSDYLDAGHSPEELIAEIAKSPAWQPDTAESSRFQSIAEIVRQRPEKAEWVVARHVERTGISGLGAKIKFGKSSLMMSAFKTVLEGTSFLGYPSARGSIVLVTEMSGNAFIAAVERAGLSNCEGLRVMQQHNTFGLSWPQIIAAAIEECKRTNAILLAIDTLNQFAGLSGDDENSAGRVLEVMRPLQQASGQGFGILYAAHERKSGGDVSDAARGSSAAGGCADILMSLGKPSGNHQESIRKISAISRFPETPTEMVIDWTLDKEYVVLGDSDAVTLDRCTAAVMAALPVLESSAKTVPVLMEETGESRATVRRVLRNLRAPRLGDGEKGNPFRYWQRAGGR